MGQGCDAFTIGEIDIGAGGDQRRRRLDHIGAGGDREGGAFGLVAGLDWRAGGGELADGARAPEVPAAGAAARITRLDARVIRLPRPDLCQIFTVIR